LNFWNSTKTVFYLAFFDSFGCDSSLILFIPSKLLKNIQKQFTPLLFKAYNSNTSIEDWMSSDVRCSWVLLQEQPFNGLVEF